MRHLVLATLCALFAASALGQPEEPPMKIKREGTEWCRMWIAQATGKKLPRVLLVGDSIANGYAKGVDKNLDGKAYVAYMATSACVCDPVFFDQFEAMFNHYNYDAVHFNNGLHGFGYSEEQYEQGYRKALEMVREKAPNARIVVALSTPTNPTTDRDSLNPRIDARNAIARKLAEEFGARVNNLHALTHGKPELYRDAYHYKPEAIQTQADQVASEIEQSLATP